MNEMTEEQVLSVLNSKIKKIDELEQKILALEEKAKAPPEEKGWYKKYAKALTDDLGEKEDA